MVPQSSDALHMLPQVMRYHLYHYNKFNTRIKQIITKVNHCGLTLHFNEALLVSSEYLSLSELRTLRTLKASLDSVVRRLLLEGNIFLLT